MRNAFFTYDFAPNLFQSFKHIFLSVHIVKRYTFMRRNYEKNYSETKKLLFGSTLLMYFILQILCLYTKVCEIWSICAQITQDFPKIYRGMRDMKHLMRKLHKISLKYWHLGKKTKATKASYFPSNIPEIGILLREIGGFSLG